MGIRTAIWVILTAAVALLFGPTHGVEADVSGTDAGAPLCRFGVNDSENDIAAFDTAALRLGWYIDYRAKQNPARPNGIEHAQMIRLYGTNSNSYGYSPNGQSLLDIIAATPGVDWYIGNEPDRTKFQDDMDPHLYAAAYQELHTLIKQRDPSAQIIAGSIVQATEVRLKYLDKVLESHLEQFGRPMPVDAWSIHGFILNEVLCDPIEPDVSQCWGAEIPPGLDDTTGLVIDVQDNDDFEIFKAQIQRFRRWMADRGYRDTPLYLSEYGILMPQGIFSPDFDSNRVNAFMTQSFDYLLNTTDATLGYPADGDLLVQRLSWYSTGDKNFFNGYLFDTDLNNARSQMGDNYANYTAQLSEEVDLHITRLDANPPAPPVAGGNATITLTAHVANAGNTLANTPTVVRFYTGDPASGGQQIGSDQVVSLSGCGDRFSAQVEWTDVGPGNYTVYAMVDPDNQVAETGPLPNKANRSIFFVTDEVYLPLSSR